MGSGSEELEETLGLLFQAHPWHGVETGRNAPEVLTAFIEIVPSDTVKYEIDKPSGLLKVDRPQAFSNVCPTLYGFVPRTYCGDEVARLSAEATGRATVRGDADPLDICVLTEKVFTHGGFLLQAIPIGGLRLIDHDEADDKIIAVLKSDAAYGHLTDVGQAPQALIDRLRHYFLTYKLPPGGTSRDVAVTHVYGREEAHDVVRRSRADYDARFPGMASRLGAAVRNALEGRAG